MSPRRLVNSLDRKKLLDKMRGSVKFNDSKHDLGLIKQAFDDIKSQSKDYELKNTKPASKYYGSYTEMM